MKKPTESGEYPTSDPHEGQVFYEGKWRRIQNRRGWLHLEIVTGGQRRLVPLEQIERERLHGQTMPVYFGYIFEGLHRTKPNAYFDAIL
jgi:hypothetical protein